MAKFISVVRNDGYRTAINANAITGITGDDNVTYIYVGSSDEYYISQESFDKFAERADIWTEGVYNA